MSLMDDSKTREYIQNCENKYAAIRTLIQEVRGKERECDYQILSSQAISWVSQDKVPEYVSNPHKSKTMTKQEKVSLDDFLMDIDDRPIKDAVRASFLANREYQHKQEPIMYEYMQVTEPHHQARVRILTRMFWDKLLK